MSAVSTAEQPSEPDVSGRVTAPTRARAAALPPEERRAEIVATTMPLLLEHGAALTTRQIAEAAGVAEGTIFRVFADKDALLQAVVDAAFDPAPTEAALAEIDRSLPLEERLIEAVEILRRRVANIFQLMSAVGMLQTAGSRGGLSKPRSQPGVEVLGQLFEPDRARLRRDPEVAAHLLRGLTLVGTHPALTIGEPMSSEEIVSLVLDGIRLPNHSSPAPHDSLDTPC